MRCLPLILLLLSVSACAPRPISAEFIGPTSGYVTYDKDRICSVQYRDEGERLLYVVVAVSEPDTPLDLTKVLRAVPGGVFLRGASGAELSIASSETVYLWSAGIGRPIGRIKDHAAVLKLLREGRPVASTVERQIGPFLEKAK